MLLSYLSVDYLHTRTKQYFRQELLKKLDWPWPWAVSQGQTIELNIIISLFMFGFELYLDKTSLVFKQTYWIIYMWPLP
jgi:hypothetical protein